VNEFKEGEPVKFLKITFLLSIFGLLGLLNGSVFSQEGQQIQTSQRLQPSDLIYLGAFRLPDGPPGSIVKSWAWGGFAMTYYAHGDPNGADDGHPGSLFGTGHAWENQVSEVSIPVPVKSASKSLSDLNTAQTLQPFYNILHVENFEMPRTGLAYMPQQGAQNSGKIYYCIGQHLQEPGVFFSHGWFDLNLANPQAQGRWRLDCPHYVYNTNDYLFDIPLSWSNVNTPGKLLATGRYRDGGWSGQGPSLFAIGPWNQGNPPAQGTLLQYVTLLRYTSTEDPESWDDSTNFTMNSYHDSDEWAGAAWLFTSSKSAVIFCGTKGTGNCWYGDENGPCLQCEGDRGWWSTGFIGQIIFYDPDDLAMVAANTMDPWEPQPYAELNIDDLLFNITSSQQKYHLGAAAFDPYRGFLYIFEPYADEDKPIVHVWQIKDEGPSHDVEPFGSFDTPSDGAVIRGSVGVTGWALDDTSVDSVKIYGGQGSNTFYIGDAVFVEGARPDVQTAYPGYPNNNRAGWGYMLLSNFLPNGGNGTFTLSAIATDNTGHKVTLGTKTIVCDNEHAVKPFGAIDTPAQGGIASGQSYVNWGWALTPRPNSIPTDGSTIKVMVDGVFVGNPIYDMYRSDIASKFPGYANSDGAVGYFILDTTQYADGVHTIQWVVTDGAGNTNGIGSRYFTIKNN
jgi:hypothetical protein